MALTKLVTNSYSSHSPAQMASLWQRCSTKKKRLRNRWRKATSLDQAEIDRPSAANGKGKGRESKECVRVCVRQLPPTVELFIRRLGENHWRSYVHTHWTNHRQARAENQEGDTKT